MYDEQGEAITRTACHSIVTCLLGAATALVTETPSDGAAPRTSPKPEIHCIGFRNDGSGVYPADCTPPLEWSMAKNLVWKMNFPAIGLSQPIIVKGKMYVMRDGDINNYEKEIGPQLICLDPADGKILWQKNLNNLDKLEPARRKEVEKAWMAYGKWFITSRNIHGKVATMRAATATAEMRQTWLADLKTQCGIEPQKPIEDWSKLPDWGVRGYWISSGSKRFFEEAQKLFTEDTGLQAAMWSHRMPSYGTALVGEAFATPVSDGNRLYLRTGCGLAMCLALDGTVIWTTVIPTGYCTWCPSPVLVGGRLYLDQAVGERLPNGKGQLGYFLDTADGHMVAEIPPPAKGDDAHGKLGYALGTPVVLTLSDGNRVIHTATGFILRPSDGKVLADKVGALGNAGNALAIGDILLFESGKDGGGNPPEGRQFNKKSTLYAIRVSPGPETDKVTCTELWTQGGGSRVASVFHDGLVFWHTGRNHGGHIEAIDVKTGQAVGKSQDFGFGQWNSIIVGDRLLVPHDNRVIVLSADKDLKILACNELGPPNQGYQGNNATGNVIASGNRLWIRYWQDLFCLGDPSKPLRLSAIHQ